MTSTGLQAFDRAVHGANEWLNDLGEELGKDGDREYAYRVLRSYLHVLRDRVPADAAVDFAAQLPVLMRGVFYDGWKPSATPATYRDVDTFLARLAEAGQFAGPTEASFVAEMTSRMIRRRMSAGQFDKVLHLLPEPIRRVLEPPGPPAVVAGLVAGRPGTTISPDELPGELRSRAMAATGNAQLRVLTRRPGGGPSGGDAYELYALAGDRFVHMRLALRADGSVHEETETLLPDQIHTVEIESQRAAIRDTSDRALPVPANVAVALASLVTARQATSEVGTTLD